MESAPDAGDLAVYVGAATTTTLPPTTSPSSMVATTTIVPTATGGGGIDIAGSWVELLSFLLLGLLAVLGVWLQRRVTRIEQQRREEEIRTQKRADLTARFDSKPTPTPRLRVPDYRLVLHNLGPAAARDVRFKIVALSDDPPPTLADGRASDFADAQPIALMDPGGEFPLQVLVLAGTARIVDVALHWTDEEGPKEKVLPLSLS
jgi:hypothetical protein